MRSATYGANTLNQYTNRTVSGTFDVLGIAHALSTTTVNTALAYRKGEYFQKAVTADNSTGAVYQAVTAQATYTGTTNTTTGNVFLAKSPEVFTYDADGNLTSDGRWTNRWDAENRLVEMQPLSSTPSGAKKNLRFAYDSQSRRISKTVSNWTGSAWQLAYDNRFVYDDWDLVAEVNATNSATTCSYIWGLDLSGTLQGAGGVAGLLVSTCVGGTHLSEYDASGNVVGLVAASSGTNSANCEYGPFGELVRETGVTADLSPVGFSTKYRDAESEFLCFGYRYYHSSVGRWLSRDPIEEDGGLNLNGFVANNPNRWVDVLGLSPNGCCTKETVLINRNKLTQKYERAKALMEGRGVPHFGDDSASCSAVNTAILHAVSPTPPCWTCNMEHRQRVGGQPNIFFPFIYSGTYKYNSDHWAVVCKSSPARGEGPIEEILFDYWANRIPGEDPQDWFRREYDKWLPYQNAGSPGTDNGARSWVDCNGVQHNEFKPNPSQIDIPSGSPAKTSKR